MLDRYLKFDSEKSKNVWGIKGVLTSVYRKRWFADSIWGAEEKARESYLNHAVDAVVIANLSPAYIEIASDAQKLIRLYKRYGKKISAEYEEYLNSCIKKMQKYYGFLESRTEKLLRGREKVPSYVSELKYCGGKRERVQQLADFANEVFDGDAGNREAVAAKLFFRDLYGTEFIRMHDDAINMALNYGYAVIRSAFCKTLVGYGYQCVLGLHHINEFNDYNLADDMMEPLRPLIDFWVDQNHEDLVDALTRGQRNELAAVVHEYVLLDGKHMQIHNAIDRYVSSLTTAIIHQNPDCLKIPQILRGSFDKRVDYDTEEEG